MRDTFCRIDGHIEQMAGSRCPEAGFREIFSPLVLDFLDTLSRTILRDAEARQYPEIAAFGFWCRRAHLLEMKRRHEDGRRHLGRGMAFHLAPSNVPAMFAYSYAIGLLAGNSNIVRVSSRTGEVGQILCRLIRETLGEEEDPADSSMSPHMQLPVRKTVQDSVQAGADPEVPSRMLRDPRSEAMSGKTTDFTMIRRETAIIRYDREDEFTRQMMENADIRVVWGGDETVRRMRQIPARPDAVDAVFPDRWSLALISMRNLSELSDDELAVQARYFYNDTFIMDQRGCSSPQLVIFRDDLTDRTPSYPDKVKIKERFWQGVAAIAEKEYPWDAYKAARKYEQLALFLLRSGKEDMHVRKYAGNLLTVIETGDLTEEAAGFQGGFGLFYEAEIREADQLLPVLTRKVQTLSCIGIDREQTAEFLFQNRAAGVDRIVPAGQALQMDTFWDGRDLISLLSRAIEI